MTDKAFMPLPGQPATSGAAYAGDWHIVNEDTGEIIRTGHSSVPGDWAKKPTAKGHAVKMGQANPGTHHYVKGQLTKMPDDVIERKNANVRLRNPHHVWDHKALDWIDPRPPEVKKQQDSDERRAQRDALLAACDWTQAADSPLTDAKKEEWQTYRQALRDITKQAGFPSTVDWPVAPTK